MPHRRNGFFAAASAFALVVACGSGSGGGSSSNACSDYASTFVSLLAKCDGSPVPPSSELAREEARLVQVCQNELALPGVNATSSDLEACISATSSEGCRQSQPVAACQLPAGSKAAGSPCNSDPQCQSYFCQITGPGTACGTCAATIADGKPCGGTTSTQCGRSSACDLAPPKTTGTCTAITYGTAGAACGTGPKQCATGFYCDLATLKCAATLGAGGKCSGAQDCNYPLVCTGQKCANPGAAGASCATDSDCTSGLGCSSKGKCGTVTWASGGQTCGDLARCLVGACPFGTTSAVKCPTVLADGQPCTTSSSKSTCDVGATCMNGKCVLSDSVVCGTAKK